MQRQKGIASRVLFACAIAIASTLLGNVQCRAIVKDETEKLQGIVSEIDATFPVTVREIYWKNKLIAEELVKSGGQNEAVANELLNMAQVSAFIEAIKYAIRMRSLSAVGQMVTSRFREQENGLFDTKHEVVMRPELVSAMVSRAILRGLADCDRYTAYNWGWLHKLIEHNLPSQQNAAFKKLAIDSYQQLIKLDLDTKQANVEFESELRAALEALGIEDSHTVNIVAVLDRMIDDAIGCTECAGKGVDQGRFKTRTMFASDEAVFEAVSEFVDDELMGSFQDLQGVYAVTPDEQAAVTRADIDGLMQKIVNH